MNKDDFSSFYSNFVSAKDIFNNPQKLEDFYIRFSEWFEKEKEKNAVTKYFLVIFETISKIDNKSNLYEQLEKHLKQFDDYCTKKRDKEVSAFIKQIIDFTNLEINRINYMNSIADKINITSENYKEKVDAISEQVEDANQALEKAAKKIDHSYSDFIAILGIFAGIVLVFFGGTSTFGNIISNIKNTGLAVSVLMCTITAIAVFNIIFMFIYYMAKLLDKNISASETYVSWRPIFFRFKERYPLIFWTNILAFSIIVLCGMLNIGEISIGDKTLGEMIAKGVKHIFINHKYTFWLCFICVAGNVIFLIAWVISKVIHINIGTNIYRCHAQWIDWEYDERKNKYIIIDGGFRKRESEDLKKISSYVKKVRIWREVVANLKTVVLMLFFKFPYMTIINTVALISFGIMIANS